jgi:branched-chain amino acid transport system substrate-binding protein
MKKILLAVLFFILINAAGMLLLLPSSPVNVEKQVIYIAVAAPMSGIYSANGEEMLRGINLYLDKIKQEEKFKDKKIELLVYDDKDKRTAIKYATQIANENKVLLVLGHYGSTESLSAGIIYEKTGIPAITASATGESVTFEKDWYFRTVSDNRFMGKFIANYMKKALGRTTVSMIYDVNEYGSTLAQSFESQARELGFSIKNKWEIDTEKEDAGRQLKNIIGWIRSAEDPGMIFCAAGPVVGVDFSSAARYPGTDYPLIGGDSFSSPAFIEKFNSYPREQNSPGYYSEGIYAAAPFIPDISGKKGDAFRNAFFAKYDKEPSWVAACYYDAMNVALEAIERAEIQGQNIQEDRRKVRDALTRFDSRDTAVQGVTGNIYFDKDGNAALPLSMGIWQKQMFLSAYWQYLYLQDPAEENSDPANDTPESADEPLTIDGRTFSKTRVVYAGIDVNKIYNFDIVKGTYTADFYVWFRFQGSFDDTRIEFTNAANPIKLDNPFQTYYLGDNVWVRSYRVIDNFKNAFDPHAYPFDMQLLRIYFRHLDEPETELIYVPDLPGVPQAVYTAEKTKEMLVEPIDGWDITETYLYQLGMEVSGEDKQTDHYSRMLIEFIMYRNALISLFLKNFLPILAMVILLSLTYLIPPDQLSARMLISALCLVTAGALHYAILGQGYRIMEYAFFATYILACISAIISLVSYMMYKRNADGMVRFLTYGGKLLHIVLASAAGAAIAYLYITYQSIYYLSYS